MEPRSTMLAALAQPKEREKLLRLEQELTRLVNNPSQDRLDMQPMSLHNRTLVHGVAEHFGLQFVVSEVPPAEPAAVGAPPEERFLPVYLCKCAETKLPAERLATVVPVDDSAPVLRQEKVQLMRRADSGAHDKSTKARDASLKPEHEQARESVWAHITKVVEAKGSVQA